jgi:hypothetical protein
MRRQPAEISWAELSFRALLMERARLYWQGTSLFLVLGWLVTRLGNLIDGSSLSAFAFFVGIADSTGMRLFTFLA